MPDEATMLATLQHADSFFPAGTAAFSWGIEALRADRHLRTATELPALPRIEPTAYAVEAHA